MKATASTLFVAEQHRGGDWGASWALDPAYQRSQENRLEDPLTPREFPT
jgi:hypothetical protein